MKISAIVAAAKNRVIGKDNQIPWYLSNDFKYFKKTTLNHHIIMGRKSFQSIGRPLPKRTNIVVTRNSFFIATGCLIAHSIEEALTIAQNNGAKEVFIIGGGGIYEQSMEYVDCLYITEVDAEPEGDVFFPKIDTENWELISEEHHKADEKNDFDYCFRVLKRKNN